MSRRALTLISVVLFVGVCSGSVPIDFMTCPNACGGNVQNMVNKGVGPTIAVVACTCNPSKSVFLIATSTSPTPTDISESFYNFLVQNSDTIKAYFSTDACGQDTDAFLKVLQANPDLTACSSSAVGDVCSQDCADQLGALSIDCARSNPEAFSNQQLLSAFEQEGLNPGDAMVKIQSQCIAQQPYNPKNSPTPTPSPSPTPTPSPSPGCDDQVCVEVTGAPDATCSNDFNVTPEVEDIILACNATDPVIQNFFEANSLQAGCEVERSNSTDASTMLCSFQLKLIGALGGAYIDCSAEECAAKEGLLDVDCPSVSCKCDPEGCGSPLVGPILGGITTAGLTCSAAGDCVVSLPGLPIADGKVAASCSATACLVPLEMM